MSSTVVVCKLFYRCHDKWEMQWILTRNLNTSYKIWQEDEQVKTGSTQMFQRTNLIWWGFLRRALTTENDELKLNTWFDFHSSITLYVFYVIIFLRCTSYFLCVLSVYLMFKHCIYWTDFHFLQLMDFYSSCLAPLFTMSF